MPSDFFSWISLNNVDDRKKPENQDRYGCASFDSVNPDQKIILNDLHHRIKSTLGSRATKGGSTLAAIIYNHNTKTFATSNLGDSKIYCCCKDKASSRRYLIGLTREDDPNDADVAAEFSSYGKKIVDRNGAKKILSYDGKKILSMIGSYGDSEFDIIHEPLILNDFEQLLQQISHDLGCKLEIEKFLLCSDGLSSYEMFLSKTNNEYAPFENIFNIICDRKNGLKGYKEVKRNFGAATYQHILSQNQNISVESEHFIHQLSNLARDLGSKDDITVGEIDLKKIHEAHSSYSHFVLGFVCDGHGPDGCEIAESISKTAQEFIQKLEKFYSNQIENDFDEMLKIGAKAKLGREQKNLLAQALSEDDSALKVLEYKKVAAALTRPSKESS